MTKMICFDLVDLHVAAQIDIDSSELEDELAEICCENHAEVMPTCNNAVWLVRGGCNPLAIVVGDDIDHIQILTAASGALTLSEHEHECVLGELARLGARDLSRSPLAADTPIRDYNLKYAILGFLWALENWRDFSGLITRILTPQPKYNAA